MIVKIEEIREEGLEIETVLSKDYLSEVLSGGEGPPTGFTARAPATLKARLDRISGGVLLKGKTRVEIGSLCKRCADETHLTIAVEYLLNLVKEEKKSRDEDEEGEVDLEGLSASYGPTAAEDEIFNGRDIDLGKITREQILLSLPMDTLCKESCKGLCSVCGKELNEGECGCDRKVLDPRLAKLKDIKL